MPLVRPTRRGLVLLLAAVVALLVAGRYQLPALLPVTGLLLGLVLLAVAAVLLVPRRLTVERSASPRVLEHGASGTVRVRVTNRSPVTSLDLAWRALLPSGLGGTVEGSLAGLGPARSRTQTVDATVRVSGEARGWHPLGPLVVDVCDPFGVVLRRRRVTDDLDLVVLPRQVSLTRLTSLQGTGSTRVGRPMSQRRGDGEDDVISRGYQPGDPPKRIDWRTTARRGELMVRQDEPSTADRVAVAIDPGSSAAPAEWALVAGASVIGQLAADGHAVATVVPGCEARTILGGQDSVRPTLVDLARLSHETQEQIGVTPPDGRLVIAVLGVVDVERAREWASALRQTAQVLALVAGESPESSLDTLRSAGWRVVAWDESDDVAARWSELAREVSRASA
ncbi:DUF58 domain-containing protein [Aeromicrobium sp. Leaf350]|uniref:DUF58 domain-containing protein n=1 Tax=Aeromicrobium sp. Leaf350 TaxID=2876565 RepID=UPI001E630534|nr:DUF58 domain-containing protein [Aeromicrobium sp. Leaf350]